MAKVSVIDAYDHLDPSGQLRPVCFVGNDGKLKFSTISEDCEISGIYEYTYSEKEALEVPTAAIVIDFHYINIKFK